MRKIFFIFIIPLTLLGQQTEKIYYNPNNIKRFADYLYKQQDYKRALVEYKRYNFINGKRELPVDIKIAKAYRYIRDYSHSTAKFQEILNNTIIDTLYQNINYEIALNYFYQKKYSKTISILQENINVIDNKIIKLRYEKFLSISYLLNWDFTKSLDISYRLKDEVIKKKIINYNLTGKSLKSKSPFISGFMSSVIPGSGRIYCNRFWEGIQSLVVITLLAYQSYDGYKNNNYTKFYIYGSLGLGLYLSDIYGSIINANIFNRRQREQFHDQVRKDMLNVIQ